MSAHRGVFAERVNRDSRGPRPDYSPTTSQANPSVKPSQLGSTSLFTIKTCGRRNLARSSCVVTLLPAGILVSVPRHSHVRRKFAWNDGSSVVYGEKPGEKGHEEEVRNGK